VRTVAAAPHAVRFVTHRDVDDDQVERALAACREVLGEAA
jgi:threonine aldolase